MEEALVPLTESLQAVKCHVHSNPEIENWQASGDIFGA